MATVYGDTNGNLLRFLRDDLDALRPGFDVAPEGAATLLRFDEGTNAALASAIFLDWNSFDTVGGVLRRNGSPVTINAPGQDYTDRQQVQAIITALRAETNLTQADLRRVLRFILRALHDLGAF